MIIFHIFSIISFKFFRYETIETHALVFFTHILAIGCVREEKNAILLAGSCPKPLFANYTRSLTYALFYSSKKNMLLRKKYE